MSAGKRRFVITGNGLIGSSIVRDADTGAFVIIGGTPERNRAWCEARGVIVERVDGSSAMTEAK